MIVSARPPIRSYQNQCALRHTCASEGCSRRIPLRKSARRPFSRLSINSTTVSPWLSRETSVSSWRSLTCSRASAPKPLPPTLQRSPISPPVRPCCRNSFALALQRAECEFLTGALAEAEPRLAALSTRATNTVERATVACLRVDLYTTLGQSNRAIAVGLDYLRHLGIDWSPHPTEEGADR